MSVGKMFSKIISFSLAIIIALGAIVSCLPVMQKEVKAATNMKLQSIKKGTNITTIDPDYNPETDQLISFKFNKKAGCKITNMDNDLPPWIDKNNSKMPGLVFQNVNKIKKNPTAMYYKVAQDKATGKYYDLKVTVTGWKKSNYTWKDPNGVTIPPFFAISKTKIGFYMLGLDSIDCTFQYLIDGEPMSAAEIADFHSYATLCDLDSLQAFKINEQPGLKGIYKMAGTDNITQRSDGLVVSADKWSGGNINDSTPAGWVTAYMVGTDRFDMSFHYAREYAPGSVHTRPLLNDIYPVSLHYGFSLQTLFSVPVMNQNIVKKVVDKGGNWDDADIAENPDMAYEIDGYKEFDYLLLSTTNYGMDLEEYVISDTLENCLEIDDKNHVSVTDMDGNTVTGQFDIKVDGQTITCSAKSKYLASDEFKKEKQEYLVRLTVHRKKSEDVRTYMKEWIDQEDGYTFYIPNVARNTSTSTAGKTFEYESNECWITDTIDASLKVEKDAKYDGWQVGSTVEYVVEVTQVKQDGYGVNVQITDNDIPPYLKLLNNQWEVLGPKNGGAAAISSVGENGWVVDCPLLQYGESVIVKFKCLVLEDANGKDTINTARATADNCLDEDGEKKYVGDDAEIWVNSPELTVDKVANAYEYQIGDRVKYTVMVRNSKDYTVAENVVVSDMSLPDGLQIDGDGAEAISVQFTPEGAAAQIGWPVPDGTTSIVKEAKENQYTIERSGNSWTVKARYLPSDSAMAITFNCIAAKAVNGIECQNQVSVTADNFLDANRQPRTALDDAEIYVNSAHFTIDKAVRNGAYEWEVGDHIPFDVTVRNVNDENTVGISDDPQIGAASKTVARNVIISDLDIPEGWRLDTDSVEVEAVPQTVELAEEMWQDIPQEEAWDEDLPLQEEAFWGEMAEPEMETFPDDATTYELEAAAGDIVQYETEDMADGMMAEETDLNPDELVQEGTEVIPDDTLQDDALNMEETPEESEETFQEPGQAESSHSDIPATENGPDELESEPAWPAEAPSVEGIPESFEEHVAGTPDISNELNQDRYNETVTQNIDWNLETVGNGWQLKISALPAGYDVKVHVICEALQSSNGQENVNIGIVTADNAPEKADDSEAYVNTAALTIDKQLINRYAAGGAEDKQDNREPYEFRVGEDIEYRVSVNNIQHGSVARNVVISDISLPEGVRLSERDDAVTVTDIPQQYVNPIAGAPDTGSQLDPDHYKETELVPVTYQLTREGTGWRLMIDNLPCTTGDSLNQWEQPIVVSFHCVATEEVNGWEIINTAKASADNAPEVKDSERIWVNSPDLTVTKTADKGEYLVGDTVTYTINVSQAQTGCVARNIVLRDSITTEGVKLQKNSIVLLDKDGSKINIPDSNIEIKGNTFTIYTGLNLIKEEGYVNWDAENGGAVTKGSYNPIGVESESSLTVEYAVEIVDRSLAGQTIHNLATVNSDEDIPKDVEQDITVEGAALDVEKTSDKVQYLVGETGTYKLTVRELREGVTAKNIVIMDAFDQSGMRILKDSMRVTFNGEELSEAKISLDGSHFSIETGKDMTVTDKIEVTYQVFFEDVSLDGQVVRNVASAKGDNTKEEVQDNIVHITDENPALKIKKTSDKQEYKVGETGHYTVKVTQTAKGATARNVVIKDALMIEGAEIIEDSVIIKNDNGRVLDKAEIEYSKNYYSIYTGLDLGYKETLTVTYDVLFQSETLAGQDILNIARVTADNVKVKTREPEPVKISDGLTIHKTADAKTGSLVANGDTIRYDIKATNTSKEDKSNILIKDAIPEYTEYVEGSAKGDDADVVGTREIKGRPHAVFIIKSLPAGSEKTVSFHAVVKDAPQDAMLINVAQVRETMAGIEDMTDATWEHRDFRNSNETIHYLDTRWTDTSHTVRIEGGSLDIEKSSDKLHYAVGETGHYTLCVTQKKKGAVSKNIVITDSLKKVGAYILQDSVAVTKDGKNLDAAIIESSNEKIVIKTNTDLLYGEEIRVTYDILFKEESLAGNNVKNVASAKGDETPEGEEPRDENTVHVEKAGLTITKKSDQEEYKVGDIAHYTLEIRNTSDTVAENVTVKDVMKQKGANILAETVKAFLDERPLGDIEVKSTPNGFVVSTHQNLSGGHLMKITYDVTMEEAALAGRDIQNVATADADNTEPAEDIHHAVVTGDSKPKPTPVPDEPPKPDRPTPTPDTPKPTQKPNPTEKPKPTQVPPKPSIVPEPSKIPQPTNSPGPLNSNGSQPSTVTNDQGGAANYKDTSGSLKGSVQTGDDSPILMLAVTGVMGLAGIITYFYLKKGKKK